MKVTIDTSEVDGGVVERVLKTRAGKFAAALDEIIYEGRNEEGEHGQVHYRTVHKTRIRVLEKDTEEKPTEAWLREIRDYLYAQAFAKGIR